MTNFKLRFCGIDAKTGAIFSVCDGDNGGHPTIEAARARLTETNSYRHGDVFVCLSGLHGKQFDFLNTVEIVAA